MATTNQFLLLFSFFFLGAISSSFAYAASATGDERKVYIVYMGSLPQGAGQYSPTTHHTTILEQVLQNSSSVSDALVRSYTRSFNGFAAKLTHAQSQKLASRNYASSVVSVFQTRTIQLHTTKSWDFVGLTTQILRGPSETDLIIGVIDTGIWRDSPSFTDTDLPPPPKHWKGVCSGGANFTCNRKLIGARFYHGAGALDTHGHGSHTASIAAGSYVADASLFGLGSGLARGGVPSSRLAVYKVCSTCEEAEAYILAAFDDAISDGVDTITISMGNIFASPFFNDVFAIGAFHGLYKNVLTVHAGGNSGPFKASITSLAPWLFSIAASTTDRRFVSKVVLPNQRVLVGYSINSFSLQGKDYPVVFGGKVGKNCDEQNAQLCVPGCVDSSLVRGTILLCKSILGVSEAFKAGAAGAIIFDDSGLEDSSTIVPFPSSILSAQDFDLMMAYYNSTKYPRATILKTEGYRVGSPPQMASFSSRGPNPVLPDILKPDITAPGVDILAAYSMVASLSDFPEDTRHAKFSVLSGTSMSCPHVAGAAAYVKSFHPEWSPSAIKSALMTTAWPLKRTNQSDEFAYGAGHFNPLKALNPGLIFETTREDYIKMLCNTEMTTEEQVKLITGDNNSSCHGKGKPHGYSARDLNYPSMTAYVNTTGAFSIKFTRKVTSVSNSSSVYVSTVVTPSSSKAFQQVLVEPDKLSFKTMGQTETFVVTVNGSISNSDSMFSALLMWSDNHCQVTSPIVVYNYDFQVDHE